MNTPDADQLNDSSHGFLWGYALSEQGGYKELPQATSPRDSATFSWLHFKSHSENTSSLLEQLALPDIVIDQLLAPETRPRLLQIEGGHVLFLRAINKNPNADLDDMVSLRLWITASTVVSVRQKNRGLKSVQNLRAAIIDGDGPRNAGAFICRLIDEINAIISETVSELDDQLDSIETSVHQTASAREHLSRFRMQSATIRRYLAPLRETVIQISRLNKLLENDQIFTVNEVASDLNRNIENLDLFRERALVLQDEIRNRIADNQGARLYVLSIISVIFLPLSFLTGVFGMNVAGLPGVENPQAFMLLSFAMLGLAVVFIGLAKWLKWL